MRLFKNISIIVFVLATVWMVKDDALSFFREYEGSVRSFFSRVGVDLEREAGDLGLIPKQPIPAFVVKPTDEMPGPLEYVSDTVSVDSLGVNAVEVVLLANKERTARGLKPYTANARLTTSAKIKAEDMISGGYFEHVSPAGKSVSDLAVQAGYQYVAIGENLAKGDFYSSKELVDAWMNSPGHRANILNAKFTEIGVSVEVAVEGGRTILYAVQHFGLPRSACGAVDEELKKDIDASQVRLTSIEQDLKTKKIEIDNYGHGTLETKNYDDLVDAYNAQVKIYNSLAGEIKQKVLQYNAQVNALNACAQK